MLQCFDVIKKTNIDYCSKRAKAWSELYGNVLVPGTIINISFLLHNIFKFYSLTQFEA